MRIMLVALLAFALGCTWGQASSRVPAGVEVVTPGGYAFMFHDAGSMARVDVALLFDAAVPTAHEHLRKYGVTRDEVRLALRSLRVHAIDDYMAETATSGTGYAAGQYDPKYRILILAFYQVHRAPPGTPFPESSPPWTRRNALPPYVQNATWGKLESPYPAMGHELGHHFFGERFEHGWVPEIKDPPVK